MKSAPNGSPKGLEEWLLESCFYVSVKFKLVDKLYLQPFLLTLIHSRLANISSC